MAEEIAKFFKMRNFSKSVANVMPKVLEYYATHEKAPHLDDLAKYVGSDIGKTWDSINYLMSKELVNASGVTEKGLKFYETLKEAKEVLEQH
jgi:predicted transcriptional regulator